MTTRLRARASALTSILALGPILALASTLAPAALGVAAVFTAPALLHAQALPVSEDCVRCHLKLKDPRLSGPAKSFPNDIHSQVGLGCLACHGSGGSNVLNPAMGFLHAPARKDIPAMCGRCHSDGAFMRQFDPMLRTDQVAEYWTSVHGKLLRTKNDTSVATCIDCHPAHNIRPPTDPLSSVYPTNVPKTCGRCHSDPKRMAGRGIPTDQVAKYTKSVHGQLLLVKGDLSAPVCNTCHGNHGAAPPGVASVRNVCGNCHAMMADNFDKSGHEQLFDQKGLPGCATCHNHHDIEPVSDTLLVLRTATVCRQCHAADDPNGEQFLLIKKDLDSLTAAVKQSQATLDKAQNLGMEVSTALFDLQGVTNDETKARNAIHSFSVAEVRKQTAPAFAIAAKAEATGQAALREHTYRREGLAVFTVFVLIIIAGLLMKIRTGEAEAQHDE